MERTPSRLAVVAAFAAVYLIWGSSYLGIRFALESFPPFLMAAARFLAAGLLMVAWARWRGAPAPTAANWRAALVVGGLLLLGGNGGVVWSEQRIDSGLAAVLVATVPLFLALMDRRESTPPGPLVLGFAGIVLLLGPSVVGLGSIDLLGAGAVLVASVCWAAGSLHSRKADLPADPILTTGMQMLGGGALLAGAGFLAGEGPALGTLSPTPRALFALAYLAVFASIVAFTAYVWLLRHVPTRYVGTYAYVNPVVAVLLGWALAGETLAPLSLVAVGIVLASVVLLLVMRSGPAPAARPARPARPLHWLRGARRLAPADEAAG